MKDEQPPEVRLGPASLSIDAHPPQRIAELVEEVGVRKARLGLLPMVFGVNMDLIGREVSIGAPSSQWWTQLASSVAGGLAFATLLTLLLTPSLLMVQANAIRRWKDRRAVQARKTASSSP